MKIHQKIRDTHDDQVADLIHTLRLMKESWKYFGVNGAGYVGSTRKRFIDKNIREVKEVIVLEIYMRGK